CGLAALAHPSRVGFPLLLPLVFPVPLVRLHHLGAVSTPRVDQSAGAHTRCPRPVVVVRVRRPATHAHPHHPRHPVTTSPATAAAYAAPLPAACSSPACRATASVPAPGRPG